MCQQGIQDWAALKLLLGLQYVALLLLVKIWISGLIRKAHTVRIVRMYVVVFLLFRSKFMTVMSVILDLLLVRKVDLEKLRSMGMTSYVVASICDKEFGSLDLHGGGLLGRLVRCFLD
jgi:hypothetical protein